MVWQGLIWYLMVAAFGAIGFGALRRLGAGVGVAWASARVVALTVCAYPAWLAGWLGVSHWWWIGLLGAIGLLVVGWQQWRDVEWRSLAEAELVGLAAFLLLAWLRWPVMDVTGTEKPMDLAIFSVLLRPGTFPPIDPWLSGHTLPYYYWGFMPFALPAKLVGLAPDVLFNLLVVTLAGICAQGAWAVTRALGGSRRSGAMAAFLVVFLGTLDGWRQWLGGTALGDLNLWPSSRQITGTITEFPLFTFHLGDLHPHVLSVPFVLVALFLARLVAARQPVRWPSLALLALVYGAGAATSPWSALPLGFAILLLLVAPEDGFIRPLGPSWRAWARALAVGAGGWLLFAPFWLAFHPPTEGFGLVTGGTRFDQLVLLMGGLLLVLVLLTWELAWRWGGLDLAKRQWTRAVWLAAMTAVAVVARRPVLAIVVGLGFVLWMTVVRGGRRHARPAFALAVVGLLLLAAMETVYFKDPYGTEFYRMNTVFKATHLAFIFLGVAAPVLLGWLLRRRKVAATFGAVVVLASGGAHLGALVMRARVAPTATWGGLGWMAPGERETAAWLRKLPPSTVLVEGVGDAYSDAARMSSASGVGAVLGWDNHEGVWRGGGINPETARRREDVAALYHAEDAAAVRALARKYRAGYVIVGAVEARLYPGPGLDVVRGAGRIAFAAGGVVVVKIDD